MKPRCNSPITTGPLACTICDGEHQCDLALAQQRKLEADQALKEGKPTLKVTFAQLIEKARKS
jgi:hypothetical protein